MGWEVKIALGCQSKHGLAESSAKTRKFFTGGVTGAKTLVRNLKCCLASIVSNGFLQKM